MPVHAQPVDLNGNGLSDVWEHTFNAVGVASAGDLDGDGADNWQESIAGTNPFDTNSAPRVAAGYRTGPRFSVSFPAVPGAQYELQSVTALTSTNWLTETGAVALAATVTLVGAADAEAKFFRVAAQGAGVAAPTITASALVEPAFTVSVSGVAGKFYELQSVTGLDATNWLAETSMVARVTEALTLTGSARPEAKFFRVAISDLDSDLDGVSDWEEYRVGTDPFSAASNGQLDGEGQLVNDYAFAAQRLALQNVLTIQATDATTTAPGPGETATDFGTLTVTRGGFPLSAATVNLDLAGSGPGYAVEGVDFSALPRTLNFPAGVSSQTITVTPLANTNAQTPVLAAMKLLSGADYTIGASSNASVVIYPSPAPIGGGLTGYYFTNGSATYSSVLNFNSSNLLFIVTNATVDFRWTNGSSPNLSNGIYSVRWMGQVQPQYSELYYFVVRSDDGCKLWVNNQLVVDDWRSKSVGDATGTIALQGGTHYNLRLEYLQSGGAGEVHLQWYSVSQPKQVIPSSRLYPATTTNSAPAAVTSALTAVGFLGQPFSYNVTGANSPLGYSATDLPPGLSFTNGLISGVPTLAGEFQVSLTAGNAIGLGASLVNITIFDTGSSVVREVWTDVPGLTVADIPADSLPSFTNTLGTLEGMTNFGVNYGERVRGFLTVPATGNYYFWLSASDAAELWISNDGEPVNKLKRASVSGGTSFRQWNAQTQQRSGWLSMIAGQKYYIEILHKAGAGGNDHWSVGWMFDSLGTNTVPAATNPIVPGYVLGRYYPPPATITPGTLYAANMLAQSGAVSSGLGTATLRVSADGTKAVLVHSFSGLSAPKTGAHIHCDPYLNSPSQIIFDIDDAPIEADGSQVWHIEPVGTLSTADILEIIRQGKAYINIHTVNYPAGEIKGYFRLANGSRSFTPPPAPPAWTDDHADANAAARFLNHATFGATAAEIAAVQAVGYDGWLSNQFTLSPTFHLPTVQARRSADPTTPYPSSLTFNTWWRHSVTAPDQLRQRVAFALSEILVVSENGVLDNDADGLSDYYDTLLQHAFGNFRELLEAVTLSPAMGRYLDMRGNQKGDLAIGRIPNENYAREILQLFSVGLYRQWPDGTLVLNSKDEIVPTYDQDVVMGFARVFTGWNYYQTNQANGRLPTGFTPAQNMTNPMVLVPSRHELGTKQLLDLVMLPAAQGAQSNSVNAEYDAYGLQGLELAHDSIFNNPNVGPFICRQLIQRLVTSHPSRDYLYRVAQKFNDNGAGVRGDMQAVIRAILLDYEARSTNAMKLPTFGKQREPVLRVTAPARAFLAPPDNGGIYAQSGTQTISITTTNAHRRINNETVLLGFEDTSGNPPPPAQNYTVTVTGTNTFTVTSPGVSAGTYGQTNNVITVNISGHGLQTSNQVYLTILSGGAASGVYEIQSVPTTGRFTVATPDATTNSGNCLIQRFTGGGYVVSGRTNLTVTTALPQALQAGDDVFLNFSQAGSPADGLYTVGAVLDPTRFTALIPTNNNQTQNGLTIYPLVPNALPLTRSGDVTLQYSTWSLGTTDTGSSSSLSQTPLRSPTVFNFFFPDYQFPGLLAAAGLTTPEFQLTSDTEVVLQMNFLSGGILNNTGNTNGLSSFTSGDGDIVLDISPWMTTNYTSAAGVPGLVDSLNTLLLAGQLSTGARTNIIAYVTNTVNFPYSTPPTPTQMRDRVRAVVHQLIVSPDFTIQR